MPRRLLFIIIDLQGGAGVFCRNLATGFRRYFGDDYRPLLLTLREPAALDSDPAVFQEIQSLHTHVDNSLLRPLQVLTHIPRLAGAIQSLRADAIITVGTYPNLLVPLAARHIPTLLTVHSNSTHLLGESRFGRLIRPLLSWRYSRATVVAPSQGVADDLHDNFHVDHVRVIPHGVDDERIRSLAEETPADLPANPYIIAVGRLTSAKDYPTLLRAYALLRRSSSAPNLLIVGDGENSAPIQSLVTELYLNGSVHLIGHRNNPYPYMKHARFLVMSSIWEGFGLVLAESMLVSTPCVATDCPSGPAEVLDRGRFGLLVPPRDPTALAAAMSQMLLPDVRTDYVHRAQERAAAFTLARMTQQYHALLSQLSAR